MGAKTWVLFVAVARLLFAPTALPNDMGPLVQALVYKFGLGLGCIGGSLMFVNWNPEEGLRDDFDNTDDHPLLGEEDFNRLDTDFSEQDYEGDGRGNGLKEPR